MSLGVGEWELCNDWKTRCYHGSRRCGEILMEILMEIFEGYIGDVKIVYE